MFFWKKEKEEANLGPCIYRQEQVVRFLFELLVDVIIGNTWPLIVLIINLSITYRKFIILFLNSVDTIFIATITCVIVNNKNKVISLYKNNDLPTIAAYIIKLWKKKMVTNLVILDEMIKSSSKKYDEMINLLKPPYRHQPKKE